MPRYGLSFFLIYLFISAALPKPPLPERPDRAERAEQPPQCYCSAARGERRAPHRTAPLRAVTRARPPRAAHGLFGRPPGVSAEERFNEDRRRMFDRGFETWQITGCFPAITANCAGVLEGRGERRLALRGFLGFCMGEGLSRPIPGTSSGVTRAGEFSGRLSKSL